MRLIMNETHAVYGKIVQAGEEFEVPDNEGRTWITIGWAHEAPARRRGGRYHRTDMRAEDE